MSSHKSRLIGQEEMASSHATKGLGHWDKLLHQKGYESMEWPGQGGCWIASPGCISKLSTYNTQGYSVLVPLVKLDHDWT